MYGFLPFAFVSVFSSAYWDCCRMAKSSFLPRRNKGYFGQKVTKTLFGNSPLNARSQTRSLLSSTWKLQFPRPLSLTRHSSLPRKAGSSGESLNRVEIKKERRDWKRPKPISFLSARASSINSSDFPSDSHHNVGGVGVRPPVLDVGCPDGDSRWDARNPLGRAHV